MRRSYLIFVLLPVLTFWFAMPARAQVTIFHADGEVAIRGYDTVAYFARGVPVKGKPDIAVMWKGVIWYFSDHTNRDRFESDPWAFAPQYGGYCAYGVSLGYRDGTEPDLWHIRDGKLYLVRSATVQVAWKMDMAGHIARADANWPGILRR